MTRKRKTKRRRTGIKSDSSQVGHRIKAMAASGLVEDQIAARLSLDKNQLRRRHIDSIKQGRAEKQQAQSAAEATELSKQEQAQLDCIKKSFASHWFVDGRNLLFGNTRTIEEALAWSKAQGDWRI